MKKRVFPLSRALIEQDREAAAVILAEAVERLDDDEVLIVVVSRDVLDAAAIADDVGIGWSSWMAEQK